jgi:integrase
MAKTVRNSKLDSRAAREKLRPSPKPYFMAIDQGLHLGYRKGRNGGKWVARLYLGGEKYIVETIGSSDDRLDADGANVLNFSQAQALVRKRAEAHAEEARIASMGPALTVRGAVETYIEARERREAADNGGKARKRDARSRLGRYVLSNERFAARPMAALTVDDLASWREGLPASMAAISARRTTADFRAALYAAAKRCREQLPPTVRDTIRDGLAFAHGAPAMAREAQILADPDVRRIISAAWEIDTEDEWGGDLARLVVVLAATGARFSQVIRMTVGDVQTARLMIPVSRKGQGVRQISHIGVPVGDDVLAALAPAIAGRRAHEILLLRPYWRSLGFGRHEKAEERRPWQAAHELTQRMWPEIVARAGLAAGLVPYALGHSSIVRGLRAGLPVRLVAALHGTSSAMIEKHYSAFVISAFDELAARAIVPLTTTPPTVTALRR